MTRDNFLQGAPEKDPRFLLPPDPPDEPVDPATLERWNRNTGRTLTAALGSLAALVGFGIGAGLVMEGGSNSRDTTAGASEYPSAMPSASPITSASMSEKTSVSPSPSTTAPRPSPTSEEPSTMAVAASPSHVPSPSVTESVIVQPSPSPTYSSPRPTQPETSQPAAACYPNENAPGEVVCTSPVWAYSSPTSNDHEFQITGGAAPDCSHIEAGRVLVAISNDQGWANLNELGNPC